MDVYKKKFTNNKTQKKCLWEKSTWPHADIIPIWQESWSPLGESLLFRNKGDFPSDSLNARWQDTQLVAVAGLSHYHNRIVIIGVNDGRAFVFCLQRGAS